VDVTYPVQTESFRAEMAGWAREQLASIRTRVAPGAVAGEWQKLLYSSGWAVPTWPEEYGGRGLDALHSTIAIEEFVAAGAPLGRATGGELLLGPTILHWGTDEQRARFLPLIARGGQTWCQGFSEPESGSDLASLRTRAVLDGDEYVLNGHKIWTSEAEDADFMFTLAITNPDGSPHRGISYFLVPMDQPGIEVRAIPQPDGRAGFNEVFLRDVRCPVTNVLGGVDNGWRVAMGTLGIERGMSATASHHRYITEWDAALADARANGAIKDASVRDRLVRSWSEIEVLRLTSLRFLTAAVHGDVDPQLTTAAATYKIFYSELHQRLTDLAMDIQGSAAAVLTGTADAAQPAGVGMGRREPHYDYPASALQATYLFSRAETIYGGTSNVQRNIISQRVLGLPREPR
jgi:alkylation response protein AidB-like acyl-CoA dehydrogenase